MTSLTHCTHTGSPLSCQML